MLALINKLRSVITLKQLLSFGLVGVGATITHACVFHLLYEYGHQHQLVANIVGFLIAFMVSYLGQFHWTFKQEALALTNKSRAFLRFFKTALIGLTINLIWAGIIIDALSLHHYIYLFFLTFITPLVIFLLNKFWVFR